MTTEASESYPHGTTPSAEGQGDILLRLRRQVEGAELAFGPSPIFEQMRRTLSDLSAVPAGEQQRGAAQPPSHEGEPDLSAMERVLQWEEFSHRVGRRIEEALGQLVANAIVELDYAARLVTEDPEAVRAGLVQLKQEFEERKETLQWLLAELNPPALLREVGLVLAIRRYTEQYAGRANVNMEVHAQNGVGHRMPEAVELSIFRILQEALHAAIEECGATDIHVGMEEDGSAMTIYVEAQHAALSESISPERAGTLLTMFERARAIGASFSVLAQQDEGLVMVLRVPRS